MKGLRHHRRGGDLDIRIIALALEGEANGEEYKYFTALKGLLHRQRRYEIHLLPTTDSHRSSPEHVFDRMNEFAREQDLNSTIDKAWLVFDRDTSGQIGRITNEGTRRNYGIAASNPCFELWLLLHHEDVNAEAFKLNDPGARDKCKLLKKRIGAIRASGDLHIKSFSAEAVEAAVERAKALVRDVSSNQRFPPCPGTFVYRIIEDLKDLQILPVQAPQPSTV
jgi:RloB-like protein